MHPTVLHVCGTIISWWVVEWGYVLQFVHIVQCPTEIRYRPKVSAETIGIGIGFGAETFSAVTEIALYCIFLE